MAEGRVAVVGSGLAGLAAGLTLKRLGYTVELFERSRLIGGKTTSFQLEGVEVDNGQHVFLGCCTQLLEFFREVEEGSRERSADSGNAAASMWCLQPRFEAVLLPRTGRPIHLQEVGLPVPFQLLPSLLRAHHLGMAGRIQIAFALPALYRDPYPGESFAGWLSRHRQGRVARHGFWDPFVVPALNGSAEGVSAADAVFVMRTAFLSDRRAARFGFSRVPLGTIAKRAAARLDRVHLRTPIVGVQDDGTGGRRVTVRTSRDDVHEFDACILAVPPPRLKSLLGTPRRLGIYGLDQFRFSAIVDIHLWFDLPSGSLLEQRLGFWALLDSAVQWVFEKEAPPGETYLCCSMSAAQRYVAWGAEQLVQLCVAELTARLPRLKTARLLRSGVTRDREATFLPSVGLVRPGPRTSCPRVVVAGAWTDTGWPATMESAVRSGRRAARVLHDATGA